MIFKDYNIIIEVNIFLVVFLIFSVSYTILLNIRARITARRKRLQFMEWDSNFLEVLEGKKGFDHRIDDAGWFAEWAVKYFTTFKGEPFEKMKEVCSFMKLPAEMGSFFQSRSREKRILAMIFFSVSGFSFPEHLRPALIKMTEKKHDQEFYHAIMLLASTWPDDYALTVITAMNREDFMTMNIKLSVAGKLERFIRENFVKIYKEVSHDAETSFFMIETAGYLKIKSALPVLKELYEKGGHEEQVRSMRAIADIGYQEFAGSFYQRFKNETDPMFQTIAFKSFLKIAGEDGIDLIVPELRNRNWFVRYAAAKALARMGKKGVQRLLENRDTDVCELALAETGHNNSDKGE